MKGGFRMTREDLLNDILKGLDNLLPKDNIKDIIC